MIDKCGFYCTVSLYVSKVVCTHCLQCFDNVVWAAGRTSRL